jgi:streptogramin lyase
VAPDGDLWFTENFANKIGRMSPDGAVIGEYPIPAPHSGPRAIVALSDGRLFFWRTTSERSARSFRGSDGSPRRRRAAETSEE